MVEMTPIERVSAVVHGEKPDRPPVSFWYHFAPGFHHGPAAAAAHLEHLHKYQLDFLKVMNDNPFPVRRDIRTADDLRDLPVLKGDEEGYGHQLELIRALAAELSGKVFLVTTLFNAWTLLRRVVTPHTTDKHHPPVLGQGLTPADVRLCELLAEDRTAVGMALDAIATSQANFARRCVEMGADGVFLSVRDDWVDANGRGTYDEMVRLGDGQILTAARGARLNILHVCGKPRDFDAFAAYPVKVINWADRAVGPAISEVAARVKPAICGGVDNLSTLPKGTPAEVRAEVRDALRQAGDHPMIVGAGCTFDPEAVPEANLHAMVDAARAGG